MVICKTLSIPAPSKKNLMVIMAVPLKVDKIESLLWSEFWKNLYEVQKSYDTFPLFTENHYSSQFTAEKKRQK